MTAKAKRKETRELLEHLAATSEGETISLRFDPKWLMAVRERAAAEGQSLSAMFCNAMVPILYPDEGDGGAAKVTRTLGFMDDKDGKSLFTVCEGHDTEQVFEQADCLLHTAEKLLTLLVGGAGHMVEHGDTNLAYAARHLILTAQAMNAAAFIGERA